MVQRVPKIALKRPKLAI